MRWDLPTGVLTMLFTDIEGSTSLLRELGADAYGDRLAEHHDVVRSVIAEHGGFEVDTEGDAFFVVFPDAQECVDAAAQLQRELVTTSLRVRMGIHTGKPTLHAVGYVGSDVHLAARIAAAGHGGQVVLSATTAELLAADTDVRELGEHRLKDFPEPTRLYQLGQGLFPPLRTLGNTNLPRPANSFVGRAEDVAEVVRLLRSGTRLLTLTGPGGSGKTRLAIEAAAECPGDFPAGVFWVPLAALRDPALLEPEIRSVLGTTSSLADHIGPRQMLLVLDNFEQLTTAAPELAALAEACPQLTLVITSRERLRVHGETELPVSPLPADDAVTLFCERSGLEPSTDIEELCRRLDGLPLAVELAAARGSLLSPAQMLTRLGSRLDLLRGGRDTDGRQQTLRATVEWSYDLLSDDEQQVFTKLSVFAGGCTVEAAEAVAGADIETLQSLVDKSLLRRTNTRLWMLETIRAYAAEALERSGEADQMRERLAAHIRELAVACESEVLGPSPKAALDRLETEHDNIRVALDWLESRDNVLEALRIGGFLWEFWCERNYVQEGFERLERLLARDDSVTRERADAATGVAHLALKAIDDPAGVLARTEQALALQHSVGSERGIAFAQYQRAMCIFFYGDPLDARSQLQQSVAAFRALGDQHHELQALRTLGWAARKTGDLATYRRLHEEVLARSRVLNDAENLCFALMNLGRVAYEEARVDDAVALYVEAVEAARSLGDDTLVLMTIGALARALARARSARLAAVLLGFEESARSARGWRFSKVDAQAADEARTAALARLTPADYERAADEGRLLTFQQVTELAATARAGPRGEAPVAAVPAP